MKKRLCLIAMTIGCLAMAAACGKEAEEATAAATPAEETAETLEAQEIMEEDSDIQEESGEKSLLTGYYSDEIILVDEEGGLESLDWKKLVKESSIGEGISLEELTPVTYFKGLIIATHFDYTDYTYHVDIFNPKNGAYSSLMTEGGYVSSIDSFEGKLYISREDYYEADNSKKVEEIYDIDDYASATLRQEDSSNIDAFLSSNRDLTLMTFKHGATRAYCDRSYTRLLEENGFIVAKDNDNNWFLLYPDGNRTEIEGMKGKDSFFYGNDSEHLFYGNYAEEHTAKETLHSYNLSTGEDMVIIDTADTVFGLTDNVFYYAVDYSDEFENPDNHVFEYNQWDETTTELYSAKKQAGMSEITMGITDAAFINGDIYYPDSNGKTIDWFRCSASEDGFRNEDTGIVISEMEFVKYGTITGKGKNWICDKCNQLYAGYYSEKFTLNGNADINGLTDASRKKINEFLTEEDKNANENFYINSASVLEGDCERHLEEAPYAETDDRTVDRVFMVGSNILAVNMGGYWYTGGAHGYPKRSQYLFDVKSGEKVTFEELYKGGELVFKEAVAAAAVELCKKEGENSPFYSDYIEDTDKLHSEIVEYVTVDSTNIFLSDEGVIYAFPPYEFGPYASSYIEILIPFDKLVMEM